MHARRTSLITHTRMRWASVVLAAGMVVLTACGSSEPSTPTNVATVTPATPSSAPAGAAVDPAGTVIAAPAGAGGTQLALSGEWLGVVSAAGAKSVRLINRTDLQAPQQMVAVGADLTALIGVGDGDFVGVGPKTIVRFTATGDHAVTTTALTAAQPTSVARTADGRTVVGTVDGHVLVLDQNLKQIKDFAAFVRVDEITVSPVGADLPAEQVIVLDRAQSSVTPINLSDGTLGAALRAGNGATNSTVDRYGRILVANTRDNEIVGFFGTPLVMRFRFPVADGPYAVDYDDKDDLLWVSTTGNNEVVAFDLASGEPIEKARFDSVAQPDSIVVDDSDGTVYVLSTRTGEVQVVTAAQRAASGDERTASASAEPTTSTTQAAP